MAAFLETVVGRGAGLGWAGDAVLAVPRPRARFERGTGDSTGLGFADSACAAEEPVSKAPAGRGTHPPIKAHARPGGPGPVPAEPLPHNAPAAKYQRQGTRASMEPEIRIETPLPQSLAPRVPVGAPQPLPQTTESVQETASLPTQEVSRVADREPNRHAASAPAVLLEPQPETERAVSPSVQDQGIAPALVDEPACTPVAPVIGNRVHGLAPEIGGTPQPRPRREEAHSVSVTIGRIEVEVVASPKPPALPQRSQPERTRGFAAYRSARRGRPR